MLVKFLARQNVQGMFGPPRRLLHALPKRLGAGPARWQIAIENAYFARVERNLVRRTVHEQRTHVPRIIDESAQDAQGDRAVRARQRDGVADFHAMLVEKILRRHY